MIAGMGKNGEDGTELWKRATKDVRQLSGKQKNLEAAAPSKRIRLKAQDKVTRDAPAPVVTLPEGGGIDRRTAERVRKGEIRPERHVDLHGLNINGAREAVDRFIRASYASGKRCVLVITGKGANKGVTIRREFTLWLEDPALKPFILSVSPAQAKDGGSGAFYIYLRRKKP